MKLGLLNSKFSICQRHNVNHLISVQRRLSAVNSNPLYHCANAMKIYISADYLIADVSISDCLLYYCINVFVILNTTL
jgi:hypothetical protein